MLHRRLLLAKLMWGEDMRPIYDLTWSRMNEALQILRLLAPRKVSVEVLSWGLSCALTILFVLDLLLLGLGQFERMSASIF